MDDITTLLAGWPNPERAGIAVVTPAGVVARGGDTASVSRVASISKVFVTLTALVALEEGTIDLDDQAGPPGATVRHLLAHAAGYAFDSDQVLADVGTRRIYSNTGIEVFADYLAEQAAMPYEQYQREAVIDPLELSTTELRGSPAHDVWSNIHDLARLAQQLLRPTLVADQTLEVATTVHFPELRGVVPGLGSFDPNPWGLGVEIRGHKQPHWTAPASSPRTFGHFGGSGTYLWVDPTIDLAAVAISGTEYGPWANEAWPATNAALLERYAPPSRK